MPVRNPPRYVAPLNRLGHPGTFICRFCNEDFAGKELWRRHRKGRPPNKQCRTPEEMMEELGMWMDRFGRWRQRHGHRRG